MASSQAAAAAAHATAANNAALQQADGKILKDLSEAEQRILANMKTASALLQSVHGKLTDSRDSHASSHSSAENLTKEYIEGVQVCFC